DISFMDSSAIWECASIMPGITYNPVASITLKPAGALRFLPIDFIFPSMISMSVFSMVPFVTVRSVPFWISTLPVFLSLGSWHYAGRDITNATTIVIVLALMG